MEPTSTERQPPLQLRDVTTHAKPGEDRRHAAPMQRTPHGLEIFIRPQKRWQTLGIACLCIISGCTTVVILKSVYRPAWWTYNDAIDIVFTVGSWIALVLFSIALYLVVHLVWERERITFSKDGMRIVYSRLWKESEQTYQPEKIRTLRVVPTGETHGILQFDYEGSQDITCCDNIEITEAKRLLRQFSDMLKFRCHIVECIVFGERVVQSHEPSLMLHNPDVSELTVPFGFLKRLYIDVATYDVLQVERFLTYAVNYLGQKYLKRHVTVYIYGDLHTLPTNLRNNLTHLCQCVSVHEEA